VDQDFFNFISSTDSVNHIKALNHLAKAGMVTVQVTCIGTAMADEKLRSPGISSCMCHRKDTTIMVLIFAI
jgi:hypothetical protein